MNIALYKYVCHSVCKNDQIIIKIEVIKGVEFGLRCLVDAKLVEMTSSY